MPAVVTSVRCLLRHVCRTDWLGILIVTRRPPTGVFDLQGVRCKSVLRPLDNLGQCSGDEWSPACAYTSVPLSPLISALRATQITAKAEVEDVRQLVLDTRDLEISDVSTDGKIGRAHV